MLMRSFIIIILAIIISGCDFFDSDKLKYANQIRQIEQEYEAKIINLRNQYVKEINHANNEINSLREKLKNTTEELEKARAEIKKTQSLYKQMLN